MPTFIMLSTLGPEGANTLRTQPRRLKEVNADVEAMGVTVVEQYALLGPYDFLNILEALPFVRRAVPDALVVLLSALPANAFADKASALGASACVTKLGTGSPAELLAELLWGPDATAPQPAGP